jgi:hypothetical protein
MVVETLGAVKSAVIQIHHHHIIKRAHPVKSDIYQDHELGHLVVTEPNGDIYVYYDGEWAAWGTNVPHAFLDDDPDCKFCHP